MRENGPLLELSTLLDRSSCIFELGTSKYIIICSMVFGCSDDMLVPCPVLSQSPVGDLCIVLRQPKILEASDFRPEFRKNMVSHTPITHTYPKAHLLEISKRYNITSPPYGTTFFRKSARTEKFLLV